MPRSSDRDPIIYGAHRNRDRGQPQGEQLLPRQFAKSVPYASRPCLAFLIVVPSGVEPLNRSRGAAALRLFFGLDE